MQHGPTTGAREDHRWNRSRLGAFAVRGASAIAPFIGAWLVIRWVSDSLWRPEGLLGLLVWLAQAIVVGLVASNVLDNVAKRALPLATLLDQTLIFPDSTPSRFGLALRAGSTRNLQKRLDRISTEGLGDNVAEAAESALELVASLSRHDRLTRGHTDRVRAYADTIAQEMGLSEEDRLRLAWGVMLHDVGKIEVPGEILNKETTLSPEEWKILRRHPAAAVAILEPLREWLGDWLLAASEHHERFDGTGYPAGIMGRDISLAGRITAVADTWDVITSARSYKSPMSHTAARAELVRCAGTQFDPQVVRAMLNVSLARAKRSGPLAALTEMPVLAQVRTAIAGASASTAAAGVATLGVLAGGLAEAPPIVESPPPAIAMAETTPTSSAAPTTSTILGNNGGPATSEPATNPGSTTTTAATTANSSLASTSSTTTSSSTPTTPASTSTTSTSTSTTSTTTTTTTPTTTTAKATTTVPPSGEFTTGWLSVSGPGNTESSPTLPFSLFSPGGSTLYNYDTDRDSEIGLTVKKDSAGLSTNDLAKKQEWKWVAPVETAITGRMILTLWAADKDLDSGESIGLRVGAYACSASCVQLGVADWSASSTSGFREATLELGEVTTSLAEGDVLLLRVVVPGERSDGDVAIAYGTTSYAAYLWVG
ncbi:MAG: HD-GYP domain-containing protein [Acidimicrobiales bacterium]